MCEHLKGRSLSRVATLLSIRPTMGQRNMGEWRAYRLEPPLAGHTGNITHVAVSALSFNQELRLPNETIVFPSNENGDILLEPVSGGKFVGLFNHEQALRKLGYEISRAAA